MSEDPFKDLASKISQSREDEPNDFVDQNIKDTGYQSKIINRGDDNQMASLFASVLAKMINSDPEKLYEAGMEVNEILKNINSQIASHTNINENIILQSNSNFIVNFIANMKIPQGIDDIGFILFTIANAITVHVSTHFVVDRTMRPGFTPNQGEGEELQKIMNIITTDISKRLEKVARIIVNLN